MKQKHATRSELLDRNPQLRKNWFTRTMAVSIVMGAQLDDGEWRHIRFLLCGGPIIILVFIFNFLYTDNMSVGNQFVHVFLIVVMSLSAFLLSAGAYGYIHRARIDTADGFKGDFSRLGRYLFWYGLIGVGVSSGWGIFGWLNW